MEMTFNPNIQIYIGDLKFNEDSHNFIDQYNDAIVCSKSFDIRIPFLDIDYLGLDSKDIKAIQLNANVPVVLTTLYPEKIDKSLECQINHKDDFIQKNDPKIYEIVKRIFLERDRHAVLKLLNETNISLFMLNRWLQSNVNPQNMNALGLIDYYSSRLSPAILISLIAFHVTTGPSYVKYEFKKSS